MSQSTFEKGAEAVDEMFHYGVKGMRWGVRKKETPRLPPSEDAQRAAEARRKAKTGSTDALSNKELQALVQRMNLEQQYSRLSAPKKGIGRKFATRMLLDKQFRDRSVSAISGSAAVVLIGGALGAGSAIKKANLRNIY